MGTIWTPGGERPVGGGDDRPPPSRPEPPGGPGGPAAGSDAEPTPEQVEAMMAAMERQLLETPAAIIVRDHAATFYQLAALHLSQQPPDLEEAQIAIDAMAALLDGLNGRIPDEDRLRDALAQLRLAFVQMRGAGQPGDEPPEGPAGAEG